MTRPLAYLHAALSDSDYRAWLLVAACWVVAVIGVVVGVSR